MIHIYIYIIYIHMIYSLLESLGDVKAKPGVVLQGLPSMAMLVGSAPCRAHPAGSTQYCNRFN